MKILKGFVSIDEFVNNVPGQTSVIGELSTLGATFSKDKGYYNDGFVPGFTLTSFKHVDNNTGNSVVVSFNQVREALSIVKQCTIYANSHIRPYNPIDFRNSILAIFVNEITNFNMGPFVDNGTLALPQWISWNSVDNVSQNKIWLANDAFIDQYDEYEMIVVPPIENLNTFFGLYNTVVTTLNCVSFTSLADKMELAKDGYPTTYNKVVEFELINTALPTQKHKVNWGILVYGKAGDNIDIIKDTVVQFCLDNSNKNSSEWMAIMPDLFKRTEFVFLPRWDKISVPNLGSNAVLYSSILDIKECQDFAKNNIDFYLQTFIEENTSIMPYDYKGVSLVVVNGESNTSEKAKLIDVIPDYVPLATTSNDFSRMDLKTRDIIIMLGELLLIAETATEFTSVPNTFRRTKRNDVVFINKVYDNVNYLVAIKSNPFYTT